MAVEQTSLWKICVVVIVVFEPTQSCRQVGPCSGEFEDVLTVGEVGFEGGHNGGFVGAKDLEGCYVPGREGHQLRRHGAICPANVTSTPYNHNKCAG